MSELEKQVETEAQPEAVDTKAEQPAEAEPAAAAEAAQDPEQPTETLKNEEAKSEDMQVAPSKERSPERSRDRSRSRDGDRRREREADKDFRARSRSRSRDRRRRSRSRSRDRRRSRSRSRSRDKRDGHRSRRSRFEEEDEEEREERRKRAAAAAAAAAPPGAFPGPPGSDAALAALRAANPALAALDPATAQLVLRQQMLLQQQLLLQQQAALQAQQVMSKAQKTQSSVQRMAEKQSKAMRELFVGNLAPGAVTEQSLYQVFHSALIAAFPQAAQPGHEPVLRVNITGRFAFVEFRLPEYATAALQLNGQIALMGNTLKIARPSSYVEPTAAISPMGIAGMGVPGAPGMTLPGPPGVGHMQGNMPGYGGLPGMPPAGPASGGVTDPLATIVPTPFLCVTGMVTADVLANDEEYREVIADLHQECSKHGVVAEVKVPRPPPGQVLQLMGTGHYGKAFVHFVDVPSAQKAKDAIHGRMFAGNIVQAFNVALPTFQSVPGN